MTACSVEEPFLADLQAPALRADAVEQPQLEQLPSQQQLSADLSGRPGPSAAQGSRATPLPYQSSSRGGSMDGSGDGPEAPRKLAVLGLPWETT